MDMTYKLHSTSQLSEIKPYVLQKGIFSGITPVSGGGNAPVASGALSPALY